MKLDQLLRFYRQKYELTLEEIASSTGVSKSTVSRWESGEIKKINADRMQALSQLFHIDVASHLNNDLLKPVLGLVKAGYDLYAQQNILAYKEVTPEESRQGDYFLQVIGDSMVGARIYDGDLIYVKSVSDVDSGEIAIVLINGDEATVKRIIKKEDLLILEASNPHYENRYFTAEEIKTLPVQIIGKVLHTKIQF